jgi:hypothetical protein
MRAESCKQVYKFNKIMETITKYNDEAVQLLDKLTVQRWTLVHDDGCRYGVLKSNGPNSISKDALRDEGCPWLINYTTQEYLVNVGQDSHFNMPPHVWRTNQTRGP